MSDTHPALGPSWIIPLELARAIATPGSLTQLHRAEARGALLRPHCRLSIRGDRFVVEVPFFHVLKPEMQDSVALMVATPPNENRCDAPTV